MLSELEIKVGAQPIAWSNDDFSHLGGDTSLEQCLAEMRQAGYSGTEMGHKFPTDVGELIPVLDTYGLELVSGWHSTHVLVRSSSEELQAYEKHLDFLSGMGCSVAIVAECTQEIFSNPGTPLVKQYGEDMDDGSMNKLADGLNRLGEAALKRCMKLVYHHHIGSVIQNDSEVNRLMDKTDESLVYLLADTGHAALAGGNVYGFFERHKHRIGHVHLKNVRQPIVDRVWRDSWSFEKAVKEGVFTVPGDDEGEIDFLPLFETLRDAQYNGWLVVEAEQDPAKANPLEYFTMAREYIKENAGV